ncbi:hypothetical protein VTN02DRAFT_2596 [Thermoascus thermophilus]
MPPYPHVEEERGSTSAGRYGPANGSQHSSDGLDRSDNRNRAAGFTEDESEADYSQLMEYPEDVDYYSLLGLSRSPPPSEADIRSAYRTLTLSFHPDKQPSHLREAAERHFERIREAYDTLIDPKKRTVYDLLGAEGVKREWSAGGAMGRGGAAERQQVGVKAMAPEEFRRWFLDTMKTRERQVVNSLVQSKGAISLGIDASSMISSDFEDNIYINIPEIRPSTYSIAYTFKAPLLALQDVWTSADEESEESESAAQGNQAQPGQQGGTDIAFTASIAGKLQRPVRQARLEYADGTSENKELPMPLIIVAKNISLGASANHSFRNVAANKGILKRFPFSLLEGTDVGVSALLLPTPTVETVVAKPVTLFPGTRPLNFSLRTTFSRSLVETPPMIGLQVSRQLGVRQYVFCSYSSGTLSWPEILQQVLLPIVEVGMNPESMLNPPMQMSKLEIGYVSLPQKSKQTPQPEEEEDLESPEEGTKASTAAESWQIQVEASPAGGSLSLSYGRNIFEGKVDEPIRSEWSSEGYHPARPATEERSVRLEVQATVGLDLSLGWNISGTRRISDFTRMGLGIGVQGANGLVFTVNWSRLGQKIKLPIAVCPLEFVNADIAALAVILPWATYCGIEFGVIRPRERRRRRLGISRRRKELNKLISKRRAESQQAIELMSEQVQRRQAREASQDGLVITKAEYGYIPPPGKKLKGDAAEPKIIDVTIPVAALVDRSQLIIPRDTTKFQILGFYDPAPLLPKKLRIWYKFGGKDHFVEADESEGITAPMRSHLLE